MAQVSIAQVDILEEAVASLEQAYAAAQENVASKTQTLSTLCSETELEFQDAVKTLEEANAKVEVLSQQLACLQQQLVQAEAELAIAQSSLAEAQAALASCEAAGLFDDSCPDCACEESEVEVAEAEIENCEQRISEISEQLQETQEKLAIAVELQKQCQQRADIAKSNFTKAKEMFENYISTATQLLGSFREYVTSGIAHLNQARQALEKYLSTHPEVAAFDKWIHEKPAKGQVLSPKYFHDRLSLSPEMQKQFSQYLYEKDANYRNLIDTARQRYNSAKGAAEKQRVLIQCSRNISGELGEKMVAYAFKPIGSVSTQSRTYFEDGKYTKTDLIISDLKNVAILGRGEGRSAPIGGSIAVEVKTGHAGYIASQKDHMVFQAGGHQEASTSIVLCSRDIKDLSPEQEQKVREALADAGSPIFATLPKKDELDQTIWEAVTFQENLVHETSSGGN